MLPAIYPLPVIFDLRRVFSFYNFSVQSCTFRLHFESPIALPSASNTLDLKLSISTEKSALGKRKQLGRGMAPFYFSGAMLKHLASEYQKLGHSDQ
jgi:hypothetical protein